MEAGPARASVAGQRPRTFYERSPVRFWQGVAALLAARALPVAMAPALKRELRGLCVFALGANSDTR